MFDQGWSAGEAAAGKGLPITQCPFGVCQGAVDENHANPLICGWVNGYMEFSVQRDITALYFFGGQVMAQEHGVALPTPANPRVKQALVDGFIAGVMGCDVLLGEVLQ